MRPSARRVSSGTLTTISSVTWDWQARITPAASSSGYRALLQNHATFAAVAHPAAKAGEINAGLMSGFEDGAAGRDSRRYAFGKKSNLKFS